MVSPSPVQGLAHGPTLDYGYDRDIYAETCLPYHDPNVAPATWGFSCVSQCRPFYHEVHFLPGSNFSQKPLFLLQ